MLSKSDLKSIGEGLNSLSTDSLKFGYAGSYARNEQTEDSDLNIVVSKNCDYLTAEEYMSIFNYLHSFLGNMPFDILHLEAVALEDMKYDQHLKELTGKINDFSPYKNIRREIIWF